LFQYDSQGDAARVILDGNGRLEISTHAGSNVRVGSIEGTGEVFLGDKNLGVGTNNLSTEFAGVLQDGGLHQQVGGSLSKLGVGTLTLTGSSTYTGGTTVISGALLARNTEGFATGTGPVKVNSGTLGGSGIIAGPTTIGTKSGSGLGAFLQPGFGLKRSVTLTIQSALTFKADGRDIYKLDTRKGQSDQVVANGLTIESGAQFDFSAVGNRRLRVGSVFTAVSNTSAAPITGVFSNLADGSVFVLGNNTFQVSYSGGDGNDLTLTVVP
ncbi:MAG: autotransporter-associated beta strand repeat-containing protein, partial [Chthoniobacterales bacterium]